MIQALLVAARQAADLICDRWTLLLVLAALQGETRFGGLLARTRMATRLLTSRLRLLEARGVISRTAYSSRPPRSEYRLTAMGEALLPIILQMSRWEDNWPEGSAAQRLSIRHIACGHPLRSDLGCSACGVITGARDIELKPDGASPPPVPKKLASHRRSTVVDGSVETACPLGRSLEIFGDKWGVEILLCAFARVRRFTDFRALTGISARPLSDRLERLVGAGVLEPTGSRHGGAPGDAGYRLTEKGLDLYGVVVAVQDWADVWLTDRIRSPVLLIHRRCGAVFHPQTNCAACGGSIAGRSDVAMMSSG